MKKLVICFITLLIATVGMAQKKDFRIGVLYDEDTPETKDIFSGLYDEISAVVGEDATIIMNESDFLVNHFDKQVAEDNYATLLSRDVDLVIAFGTTNSLCLSNATVYPKPTIIAGGVFKEGMNLTADNYASDIDNLSFVVVKRSFEEDIKTLKSMTDFRHIALVVNKDLFSTEVKTLYDDLADELGFNYTVVPFTTLLNDYSFDYDVDAVYFSSGYFLPRDAAAALADTFIVRRIPSLISGGLRYVKAGMMATTHGEENIVQYLRRLALMTEDVVNGINASQINGFIDYESQLAINFSTMTAIGVEPKYSILYNVSFVDEELKIKSEQSYTLSVLMQEALENNLGLKTDYVDVQLVEQEVKLAKSGYYPEVTASTSLSLLESDKAASALGSSPEYTGSANVSVNQVIYSNELSLNQSIQKSLYKAQQESYNSEELNTVFDAVTAYFASLALKTNLQIVRLNLQLTEKNLAIAKQNYMSGQAGKADILRFEGNKAEDTKSLIENFSQLRQSYFNINVLLNNSVYRRIDVDETELTSDTELGQLFDRVAAIVRTENEEQAFIEFLAAEAVRNAPELKALQYNIEATEYSIKRYGARRYIPTVGLSGGYDHTYMREGAGSTYPVGSPDFVKGYYSAGLNVSVPIFSRHQQVLEQRKAMVKKEMISFNYDEAVLNIHKSIACVIIDIGKELSNIELSAIAEGAAKESYELTLDSYTNGAVPIVQLLDAQSYYIQAKLSHVNAKYDFLLAMFTLERYVGRFMFLSTSVENEAFISEYKAFKATRN